MFYAVFAIFSIPFVGGTDLAGNPLITFPTKSLVPERLWEIDGACRYLVYLQDVIYLIMKRKTAAFVANFVKALEHLEVRTLI